MYQTRRWLQVGGLYIFLACVLTWPQVRHLSTGVASHIDPFFSTWRLAWIAHALATDPSSLYHANIFHPDRNTLANSDAVVLEGALAAPFLWAGLDPFGVYNVVLLAGIVLSGVTMFILARALTGNEDAGVIAGAIFLMLPYRVLHIEHLELQWACFVPPALLAVHRAIDRQSIGYGILAGVLTWLQLTASIYYGIYLAIALATLTLLLLAVRRGGGRSVAGLALGGALCAALAYVSSQPYLENSQSLGTRPLDEIARYSARPSSYLMAPPENWWWGWTARGVEDDELQLFPGVLALLLAAVGVFRGPRPLGWIYLGFTAILVELSFGTNGVLYPILRRFFFILDGLRAPARMAMIASAGLAVLAAFGFASLQTRLAVGRRRSALGACLVLLTLEYASLPIRLEPVSSRTPEVYQMLRRLPPGPVVEVPLGTYDTVYMVSSIAHWFPLVNGYSGFIPERYLTLMEKMENFPDTDTIRQLVRLGVRYVIVHEAQFSRTEYVDLMLAMRRRPELIALGRYRASRAGAEIFEVRDYQPARPGRQ